MKAPSSRMPLIDALKAVASQFIVLHHLAAYGPLSETLEHVVPNLMGWLYDYARIAVQVFLVIGGFLAARGLAPHGVAVFGNPVELIWRRYVRLAVPYLAAIAVAILGAALARHWMIDEDIPNAPRLTQWLAHALLLHGILGYESLSAGVWYIAVDFQLFALMVLTLWFGRLGRSETGGSSWVGVALVVTLVVAALFWFNRDASWDNWALYFFGSYGLGAVTWWATQRGRMLVWLGIIATVVLAALVVDFRLRLAVALAVALVLGLSRRTGWPERWTSFKPLAFLGKISYSVFLIHFPICLVANAIFIQYDFESPGSAAVGMLLAWGTSVAAGACFHRYVESAAPGWQLGSRVGNLLKALADRLIGLPIRSGS